MIRSQTAPPSTLLRNRVALGTWTIGGPWERNGRACGLGAVDDRASVDALRRAIDSGISVIDTADVYGCGHAERLVGNAVQGVRDQVFIATKFGTRFDEDTRQASERCIEPDFIRTSCDASLRRLGTDHIDLYQLHWAGCPVAAIDDVITTLVDLRTQGKIVEFGWSTDEATGADEWLARGGGPVQHPYSLIEPRDDLLELTGRFETISLCRSPLGTGALAGSQTRDDDIRRHEWTDALVSRAATIRAVLDDTARRCQVTPVELALRWVTWRADNVVTIVGFRSKSHVDVAARADNAGPLPPAVTKVLDQIAAPELGEPE